MVLVDAFPSWTVTCTGGMQPLPSFRSRSGKDVYGAWVSVIGTGIGLVGRKGRLVLERRLERRLETQEMQALASSSRDMPSRYRGTLTVRRRGS